MIKLTCTAALLALASVASANHLTLTFDTSAYIRGGPGLVDVYAYVTGDNLGLLNYDISVSGITGLDGVASDGIDYEFARLSNLNTVFQPTGFPLANNLRGASGPDDWSAGASQFGAANPIVGLGRTDVFSEGSSVVPGNPDIDIPFVSQEWFYPNPVGSYIGSIDFGVPLSSFDLRPVLGGGGTVFGAAGSGVPIPLDGPATIHVIPIPEPSTGLLAGVALAGLAARRQRQA